MGYGVGLIGCGNIAGTWVKAVGEHTDCNLDLVFDLDRDAAQKRADESGARAIGELEEMLASVEIDLVVIGTPTPSHPDLVVQAAAAGKLNSDYDDLTMCIIVCVRALWSPQSTFNGFLIQGFQSRPGATSIMFNE